MNEARIGGERLELIQEAFRGMKAEREADGWVSVTGRLDPVPGEALMRALRATELELPRRIGSTRDEHRAAALDEIARQVELLVVAPGDASADVVERGRAGRADGRRATTTRPRTHASADASTSSRHPVRPALVKAPT